MKKISVMIPTYDHAPFIERAVTSALDQKGVPDMEIIVGEDRSNDGTYEILRDLQKQYPDIIQILRDDRNLGYLKNYRRTFLACEGDYIAMLDGDDYWLDDNKLRLQLDFMEANPDFAICFHDVLVLYEDESRAPHTYVRPDQDPVSTLSDLLLTNFIPFCSAFFRNHLIKDFPDWYIDLHIGDYPLHILNAVHGKIGYIDEVMSVYRVHWGGVWGGTQFEDHLKSDLEMYRVIGEHLGEECQPVIARAIEKRMRGLASVLRERAHAESDFSTVSPAFISEVESIVKELKLRRRWSDKLMAEVFMDFAFHHFEENKFRSARRFWLRALAYDPKWVRNRGALSIGIKLFSPRFIHKTVEEIKQTSHYDHARRE